MLLRNIKLRNIIFIIVGICLIIFLFYKTDIEIIKNSISLLNSSSFIILLLLQFITFFLIAFQWKFLFSQMKQPISVGNIAEMNLVGTFFETITPAVKVGGEAFKILFLKKLKHDVGKATAVVAMQKLISLFCFLLLSILSLIIFFKTSQIENNLKITLSIIYLTIIFIIIAIIIMLKVKKDSSHRWLGKYQTRFINFKNKFYESIQPLFDRKHRLLLHIGLGLIIWLLFAYKTYFILQSFSIDLNFYQAAIITFITYMVGLLPLLPGGLGTFEGSMILLLAVYGVEYNLGLTVAIILRFFTFWLIFLVSCLYLGGKKVLLWKQ